MTKKHRSALRRFRRVQEFLTTNAVEGTTVKLKVLDDVVREMSSTAVVEDASTRLTRGETARQAALRNALWNQHMVPIARIARRAFGGIPKMDEKFILPPKRADNDAILKSAGGMADVAEAHAEVFVSEGLPSAFVQQLRSAIDALSGVTHVRVESKNRRTTSREAIDALMKRGVAAVDVLDAIVKPRLEARPDLLAAWKSVKRPIEPGGVGRAGSGEPDITPVVKVA